MSIKSAIFAINKRFVLSLFILICSSTFLPVFFVRNQEYASVRNEMMLMIFWAVILFVVIIFIIVNWPKILTITTLDFLVIGYFTYSFCVQITRNQMIINAESLLFYCGFGAYAVSRICLQDELYKRIFLSLVTIGCLCLQISELIADSHLGWLSFRNSASTGPLGNPNIFCVFQLACLPAAFYFMFLYRGFAVIVMRGVAALSILLAFIFIINNVSRASLLVASLLFFLTISDRLPKSSRQLKKNIIIGLAIISAIGISLVTFLKPASTQGRVLILKVAAQIAGDTPFFGYGSGGFSSQYNLHQAAYFESGQGTSAEALLADQIYTPLNELLRIYIEQGPPGLLLFSLIPVFLIFCFFKHKTGLTDRIIFISLVGIMVISFFSYPLMEPIIFLLFFTFLGALSSQFLEWKSLSIGGKWVRYLLVMSTLSFATLSFNLVQKYIVLDKWQTLVQQSASNWQNNRLSPYRDLSGALEDEPLFLMDYGERLFLAGNFKYAAQFLLTASKRLPSISVFLRLASCYEHFGDLKSAEKSLLLACHMVPNRFISRYELLMFYQRNGQKLKQILTAKYILAMPVKVPSATIVAIQYSAKRILKNQ